MVNSKYEQDLVKDGVNVIAGVDEAGCGPLAGPVVAACIVLSRSTSVEGINDSKKLTPKKRNEIYERLKPGVHWGWGLSGQKK